MKIIEKDSHLRRANVMPNERAVGRAGGTLIVIRSNEEIIKSSIDIYFYSSWCRKVGRLMRKLRTATVARTIMNFKASD